MARKLVKKWNPNYSKTSVRMALQNAMSKRSYGDLTKQDKDFIQEVLTECDAIAKRKEEEKEQS
tara:strand:- start:219 stop:410 length:192 start_codon:yes stop_codon:yes gene_type:complete